MQSATLPSFTLDKCVNCAKLIDAMSHDSAILAQRHAEPFIKVPVSGPTSQGEVRQLLQIYLTH
jgi:hypothetical protein